MVSLSACSFCLPSLSLSLSLSPVVVLLEDDAGRAFWKGTGWKSQEEMGLELFSFAILSFVCLVLPKRSAVV
ncbi:hypothetical protein B0H16DRAFT_1541870 [Mycena metata]|uniref:Secreted protein n=1 Tax=Mycena metata TaxID=1033252 RepID=A0AAD7J335_9AGAR|nr:hypothetical protein B0H16DRAFT_1541870 [Mycena metata]